MGPLAICAGWPWGLMGTSSTGLEVLFTRTCMHPGVQALAGGAGMVQGGQGVQAWAGGARR